MHLPAFAVIQIGGDVMIFTLRHNFIFGNVTLAGATKYSRFNLTVWDKIPVLSNLARWKILIDTLHQYVKALQTGQVLDLCRYQRNVT